MMYDYRGNNIVKTKIVQARNEKSFQGKLHQAINDMQKERLFVEVKLATDLATSGVTHFTALVLGRS